MKIVMRSEHKATLYRGIWRKEMAEVHRNAVGCNWYYDFTGQTVDAWADWRLDRAAARFLSPWVPVSNLPKAKLLKGG